VRPRPLLTAFARWKPGPARSSPADSHVSESPLRAELFNREQLQRHAHSLASHHQLDPRRGPNRLLLRLAENEQVLVLAYDLVTAAEAGDRAIAPAGEWLLDNYYLIEQQIRLTRRHLPRNYSRELPRLLAGPSAGLPRVYDIVLELIAHGDGRVDADNLTRFVTAYQTGTSLTVGELWAVPIMLRLALIENLRRVAAHIARRREDRNLANHWADHLTTAVEQEPKRLLHVLAELAESEPPFNSQFVEELCSRLQGVGVAVATVQSWVDHQLAEQGLSREQLQRTNSQAQAADQVSISHSIGSLRFLGALDWRDFVESLSVLDQTLRTDPAQVYAGMAFATRDHYRHVVESLARQSGTAETAVADTAIQLATAAATRDGIKSRAAHVGYYLIAEGRSQLERAVHVRWSLRRLVARVVERFPLGWYVGPILAVTTATASLVWVAGAGDWRWWLLLALGFAGASQLAIALINLLTTMLIGPRTLPRLDYSKGIPAAARTMVVIPTLLTRPQGVTDLLEGLEVRYLGNRDPHLLFALLTDFSDAAAATQPGDAELVGLARDGIAALNVKYGRPIFYLFHRPRVWNPHERCWMGYERKRGKLEQFNALLRGGPREPFSEIVGDLAILARIHYVLTLDTDTALPRDAARKLAGTMAHPLNRPQYDSPTGRVVAGYAILQPRTPISLLSANRSRFAKLSAGEVGVDPYTGAVSDVYQDLFAEGSYVGKGIYDVDAFQQATTGRFPENLILSHDLIESGYARSALVTDVELHEDHPASYAVETSRRHRWIRGDWQIAGWLWPRVNGAPNPLSALARWKILDNLRRSLVSPALLLLLLGGWVVTPAPTGFWTIGVFLLLLLPVVFTTLVDVVRKPRERVWSFHFGTILASLRRQLVQAGLTLCTLPHRAVVNLDAIVDSGLRMLFTRRGLLLWHTPRYAKRNNCKTLANYFVEMWVAPLFGLAGFAWLAVVHPTELTVSAPVLLAWMLAPVVGWWISRPLAEPPPVLAADQWTFLRSVARQTWRYFEVFVNATENWLPPDNFQEMPQPVVAPRTSPTNIGMALLANLTACDFGYISTGQFLERTEHTLATMEHLERYRGHFYNWYDTRTRQPLRPYYVSSVDSGNLAGALWTLRAGLLELKTQPIISPRLLAGLRDTLGFLANPLPVPDNPPAVLTLLQELRREAAARPVSDDPEQQWWTAAFVRQCDDARKDLQSLVSESPSFENAPTLQELAAADNAGAGERLRLIDQLAQRCTELAAMNFAFLYDTERDLLAIGYNVTDRRRDPAFYDLLASEARLASFILVAQNQLPQDHWFALGRQLTLHDGKLALLSWSGSMFEYLMPLLIMPTYENTLLDQTYRTVVARQIEYGRQRGVPWGISESCYNASDAQGIYQYGAFGLPGLGFKRGLADDLVVAPYASALALMIAPREACENLEKLAATGYRGAYGFYESIDFTPARVPPGQTGVTLHTFMVHHQGMSLLALAYLLLDRPMQRRFLSDPYFKATELLLQERLPKVDSPLQPHAAEVHAARKPVATVAPSMRVFPTPNTLIPEVHLLSNGRYHVMVTNAGGGYSRWNDLAVTRWREDATCDGWGLFGYLRDAHTGTVWSTAYQPMRRLGANHEAIFVQGRAEFRRCDEEMDSYTEIAVSPEDDVEVRRVTLRNLSPDTRTIELTSYAEVVIAPPNTDLAHPAFSNLFVHTEILPDSQAILCTRRAREPGETPPWMFHLLTTQGTRAGVSSYETDRAKFIGRGRSVADPVALDGNAPLSNSAGAVLDPIVAIRQGVMIAPDTSANWHIITGMAETRAAALTLIAKYRDSSFAARAFEMAWSHSHAVLRQLHATEAEAQVFAQLAASVIYANPLHRAGASVLTRNRLGQSGLWGFGISGDLPILLMRIADVHRIELVKQVLNAHAYWRLKGLEVDLVILNEDFSGYRQVLNDRILNLVATGTEAHRLDKPGGIFIRRSEQLSEEDRVLLQTIARAIITDSAETLAEQVESRAPVERKVPRFVPTRPPWPEVG